MGKVSPTLFRTRQMIWMAANLAASGQQEIQVMGMSRQSRRGKAIAEAVAILTAPGAEADPFESKQPEVFQQIIAESVSFFVRENRYLPNDADVIAEEFLRFMEERQTTRPQVRRSWISGPCRGHGHGRRGRMYTTPSPVTSVCRNSRIHDQVFGRF
jgi:hypothetical protein